MPLVPAAGAPGGGLVEQSCERVFSVHVHFASLLVEEVEEHVLFDWKYVLGATGGALTIAKLVFNIVNPLTLLVLFGRDVAAGRPFAEASKQAKVLPEGVAMPISGPADGA